jgi:hypothetical protein
MGTIYDMANGTFHSPPAQAISAPTREEIIPAPALRLRECPSPADIDAQPHSHNVHLIRALFRQG